MAYARPGTCQHPLFSDEDFVVHEDRITRSWGDLPPLQCPNCREYLYPYGSPEDGTIYVGEPHGAGADPAGRPDPSTHPEFWTE